MPRYWPKREAEAIAAWNTRATQPATASITPAAELVEAAKVACYKADVIARNNALPERGDYPLATSIARLPRER